MTAGSRMNQRRQKNANYEQESASTRHGDGSPPACHQVKLAICWKLSVTLPLSSRHALGLKRCIFETPSDNSAVTIKQG